MDRPEQTLSAVLDAGELLLTSGAEAARVEDTMRRLARAYGFVRADVLTITASMAVTVRTADDQVITQTRRILRRGTDMRCIEAVNELSREVCVNPIPPEELHARLEAIRTAPDKLRCRLPLAYLITSGSFAVFFGGTWRDGIAAMLCSVLLYVIGVLGDRFSLQPLVLTMVSSAAILRGSGSHGKNRHGTESGLYHYRQHHAADSGHSVRQLHARYFRGRHHHRTAQRI